MFTKAGFECWKPGNKARFLPGGKCFSQSQDIHECADFEAIKSRTPVVYIQSTCSPDSNKYGLIEERRKKFDSHHFPNHHVILLVIGKCTGDREKSDKWVVSRYNPSVYLWMTKDMDTDELQKHISEL
jgi:hypothetical protein